MTIKREEGGGERGERKTAGELKKSKQRRPSPRMNGHVYKRTINRWLPVGIPIWSSAYCIRITRYIIEFLFFLFIFSFYPRRQSSRSFCLRYWHCACLNGRRRDPADDDDQDKSLLTTTKNPPLFLSVALVAGNEQQIVVTYNDVCFGATTDLFREKNR